MPILLLIFAALVPPALAEELLPLDVHVHYTSESVPGARVSRKNGQKDFLASKLVQRAFLIAPTYQYAEGAEISGKRLVPAIHREMSDFIQAMPDRYTGLCGLSLEWNAGSEELLACLGLPGMKGIKLHCKDSRATVDNEVFYLRLKEALLAAQGFRPFVLWHFDSARETEAVFRIAKEFPEVSFILAHSMNGALERWNQLETEQGAKLANVWIEISTAYAGKEEHIFAKLVPAWRAFGLKRVLFGSDLGYSSAEEHKKLIEGIKGDTSLSAEEKQLILEGNGRDFWQRVEGKKK